MHDLEARTEAGLAVLMKVETAVVALVIFEDAKGFTMLGTSEQQRHSPLRVAAETVEHPTLIVGREVERLCQGDRPVKRPANCNLPHIRHLTRRAWQL